MLQELKALRPGLSDQRSITWLVYDSSPLDLASGLQSFDNWSLPIRGAAHRSDQPRGSASVVKRAYSMAVEKWLSWDLLM